MDKYSSIGEERVNTWLRGNIYYANSEPIK